jgi:hypothetical protein
VAKLIVIVGVRLGTDPVLSYLLYQGKRRSLLVTCVSISTANTRSRQNSDGEVDWFLPQLA